MNQIALIALALIAIALAAVLGFLIGRRRVIALQQSLKALDFRASKIRAKAWQQGFEEGRASERAFVAWDKAGRP